MFLINKFCGPLVRLPAAPDPMRSAEAPHGAGKAGAIAWDGEVIARIDQVVRPR